MDKLDGSMDGMDEMPDSAVKTDPCLERFAQALHRAVRNLANGEYHAGADDGEDVPEAVVTEARALLSSLHLSSDAFVHAVAAREVQRARAFHYPDRSGRVTATRVLYALDRYLAGLPPDEGHVGAGRTNRREGRN